MNTLQRESAAPTPSSTPGPAVTPGVASVEASATTGEPPVVDGRSARWETHREERRRALIKAARRAIHRLGPDASMDEIAATAGTSKSVFYRYFGDKSGLRQAVGAVVIRQMQDTLTTARQNATQPRQGVTAMVAAYLEMAQTSPNVYFFSTLPAEGEVRPSGELSGFFDSVTAMITEPLRHLLGDPESPLLGYWPTAAIGLVRTTGELWLQSPEGPGKPDSATMAQQISAWLFDGVGQLLAISPTSSIAAEG